MVSRVYFNRLLVRRLGKRSGRYSDQVDFFFPALSLFSQTVAVTTEAEMTRKNKRKVVLVGSTPVKPFTAKQLRAIDRKIRQCHALLRRKYKEIRGKKVDWVSHAIEDGWLYFTVRFTDKTALHLIVSAKLVLERVELSDWTTGDDKILRTYYRRKDST
jgi:hypothetical protein